MTRLHVLLRFALGAIFLAGSWDKLLHPAEFAAIIADYRVLSEALVNPAAVLLPWLELVLGLLLVAGRLADGALWLSNLLLWAFWLSLLSARLRGLDVDCGCFSVSAQGGGHMTWYLVRDGLLVVLGLAALLTRGRGPRSFAPRLGA